MSYQMLSWNGRGLNNPARQEEVKQIIGAFRPDLVCLQETKLSSITMGSIRNILGVEYGQNFFFLPADGTRGGILITTRESTFQLQQPHVTTNTISATVLDCRSNAIWSITGVYCPQGDLEKKCS
jgi:exonuclease III